MASPTCLVGTITSYKEMEVSSGMLWGRFPTVTLSFIRVYVLHSPTWRTSRHSTRVWAVVERHLSIRPRNGLRSLQWIRHTRTHKFAEFFSDTLRLWKNGKHWSDGRQPAERSEGLPNSESTVATSSCNWRSGSLAKKKCIAQHLASRITNTLITNTLHTYLCVELRSMWVSTTWAMWVKMSKVGADIRFGQPSYKMTLVEFCITLKVMRNNFC